MTKRNQMLERVGATWGVLVAPARRVLALVVVALGCRGRSATTDSARAAAPATGARAVAPAKDSCPADGRWAECSLMKRLDEAGLAPKRESAPVTLPPLSRPGTHVTVGASELDLFFYPDSASRARDEAKLDPKAYVAYDAPQTIRAEPTLIHSVNVIAILHSRRDQQRERVSDAITAGPPQPSKR